MQLRDRHANIQRGCGLCLFDRISPDRVALHALRGTHESDVASCYDGVFDAAILVDEKLVISEQARIRQPLGIGLIADRKSTRLNSSHVAISYAVFCLKKTSDQRQ